MPVADEGGATPPPVTTRRRPRSRSLLRALSYHVPAYVLAILGYLVLAATAARLLGTADFGYYMLILSVTTVVGQLSLLGVHRSGLREAARADDDETLRQLRRGVRSVMWVPLPLASVATAVVTWLWWGAARDDLAIGLLTGSLVFAAGYQKISANFLRGLGHVKASSLITGRSGGALVSVAQALFVLGVGWAAPGSGLVGVLLGTTVGSALPLVWAWWMLRGSWPDDHMRGAVVGDLRRVARRDWRFAVSQTGGFLNSTIELWLAAAILSGGATSLYAASQRLAQLLVIPASSLQTVFSPALSRLANRDDDAQLEPLVRTAATVSTAISAVLWLPMVAAPALLLTVVFGEGFGGAAAALMLLATGCLLNSVSGMSAITLSMAHHEGAVAVATWGSLVLRVASGSVCAVLWGITGLAASSTAITILFYVVTWWQARRLLSISTHATLRPQLALLRQISG